MLGGSGLTDLDPGGPNTSESGTLFINLSEEVPVHKHKMHPATSFLLFTSSVSVAKRKFLYWLNPVGINWWTCYMRRNYLLSNILVAPIFLLNLFLCEHVKRTKKGPVIDKSS
jgi:hypothetical protein